MTEEIVDNRICTWVYVPMTPVVDSNGVTHSGFNDQWQSSCQGPSTFRTEPRAEWKTCPYCANKIVFGSDPDAPGMPKTVAKAV